MGSGASKDAEADKRNKEIELDFEAEKRAKSQLIKLLLLGAGECGKSTILKQMKIANTDGFSEEDYKKQRSTVFSNIIQAMYSMVKAMETLQIKFEAPEREVDAKAVIAIFENGQDEEPIDDRLKGQLHALWLDKGVLHAYSRSSEYQLNDSAKYFLDKLDEIAKDDYLPSQDDVLRCRVKTTGVVEVRFTIKGMNFRVFDVGGQRSERKKWIHCFDDVNAIIFIAAISEYDQVLYEDGVTNRMIESMRLFESICNNQWFAKTSFIVFFNKKDLFEQKINSGKEITSAFPEYQGGNNYNEASTYIKDQYIACCNDSNKQIFSHLTCATDTEQVKFILDSSMDTIIQQNMSGSGLY